MPSSVVTMLILRFAALAAAAVARVAAQGSSSNGNFVTASSTAWYQAGTFDIANAVWPDASGDNDASFSGLGHTEKQQSGHGASKKVVALAGTISSIISFGNVIKTEFTICSVTRYTNTYKQRILQGGEKNWLHGHWSGMTGIVYYDGFKTQQSTSTVNPTTDWLVLCGTNAGSQLKLANGVDVGTASGGSGDVSLGINTGNLGSERSDFAVAEVVVWDRGLAEEEIHDASEYLMRKFGIGYTYAPTDSPTASPTTASPTIYGSYTTQVCSRIVHCKDGTAYHNRNGADFTDPTGKTCYEECDGYCCSWQACRVGAFSVCADGSCMGGYRVCDNLGYYGSVGLVYGPSCVGNQACVHAGEYGTIGNIANSCDGNYACSSLGQYGVVGDVTNACKGESACLGVAKANRQFASNTILDNCCLDDDVCKHGGCYGYMGNGDYCVSFQDDTCPAATASPTEKPTVSPTQTVSPTPKLTSYAPSKATSVSPSLVPSDRPSKLLSGSPSVDLTGSPSSLPTDAPLKLTSVSPSVVPQFHVVCGKGTGCAEGNQRPAHAEEKHAVRCCADEKQGNGWKKQDNCNVWAYSITPHCYKDSFAKAMQICDDAGARLCTKDQLADRCTITTGCGFDHVLVWSSSPVMEHSAAPAAAPADLTCRQQDLQELREEVKELRALVLSIHEILDGMQ